MIQNAIRPPNTQPANASETAVTIHSRSSRCKPSRAYGTVNRNGSGFHDGAPPRSRFQCSAW